MAWKSEVTGNGNEHLVAVHDSMLNGLGQLANYLGFSRVMGQLYGALLLSDRPLCLDDMVERLDISKASASMNVRTLENLGMVRQVLMRGSDGRRKFYEAETDFWQIIANILNGREMRDLERALAVMQDNIDRLTEAVNTMGEDDRQLAEVYIDRISRMQALFQFAQVIITMVFARAGDEDLQGLTRVDIG